MGPGKSISFGWNCNNKYWRTTRLFNMIPRKATASQGILDDGGCLLRFDERLGTIGGMWNNSIAGGFNNISSSQRILSSITAAEQTVWEDGQYIIPAPAQAGSINLFYMDPNPMPGLYLHLQPQLGAISTGISDSVCQVQFELEADLLCTGRLPRITSNSGISLTTLNDTYWTSYTQARSVQASSIPLYYDCAQFRIDGQLTPT